MFTHCLAVLLCPKVGRPVVSPVGNLSRYVRARMGSLPAPKKSESDQDPGPPLVSFGGPGRIAAIVNPDEAETSGTSIFFSWRLDTAFRLVMIEADGRKLIRPANRDGVTRRKKSSEGIDSGVNPGRMTKVGGRKGLDWPGSRREITRKLEPLTLHIESA